MSLSGSIPKMRREDSSDFRLRKVSPIHRKSMKELSSTFWAKTSKVLILSTEFGSYRPKILTTQDSALKFGSVLTMKTMMLLPSSKICLEIFSMSLNSRIEEWTSKTLNSLRKLSSKRTLPRKKKNDLVYRFHNYHIDISSNIASFLKYD